jgi:stringent starvation protein B
MRVPDKRQTLLSYLQRGVAMVHLDARRPGVVVPPRYLGDAHLRLNLSYRYSIPDLEIDDRRVQATLSFGGQPFHCVLPWQAIFGITSNASGDGQVWPEDLPVEVVQTMADRDEQAAGPAPAAVRQQPAAEQREPPRPAEAPRRHLRLVR